MATMTNILRRSALPDGSIADKDFRESSFFRVGGRQLPDPSTLEHRGIASRHIVTYSDLRLVIKYGRGVTIDEAITMLAIRNVSGCQIPVPEVCGWRTRDNIIYIYMELILGVTMEQRLRDPNFSHNDKEIIRQELRRIVKQLQQLKQEDTFIGSITRSALGDCCFYDRPPAGPFEDVREFYDWMEWLVQRYLEPSQRFQDPYLALMPKNSSIVFTHADLHPTNIMVSKPNTGPPRVLALIDWGQSGWYPDYWEYFKMCYTTPPESQWRNEWATKILDPRENENEIMAEFTFGFGAV